MSTPLYNNVIRKITVGFGNLFNNIFVVRYNTDGTEAQRFLCPIEYASKEKYVSRLQGDPNLDRKVQVSLPALSFEMTGMSYDSTRKQITNVKNFAQSGGQNFSQYNPVPYNFDFKLYAYVRNEEDGNQIIETILPFFTPDYTIKVNMIPEMGTINDVPIVLNDVSYDNDYEGSFTTDVRTIIWTLSFTVKGYIYGNMSGSGLITNTITNIYKQISGSDSVIFSLNSGGVGSYQQGEVVYQGYSQGTATATATIVDIDTQNQQITLQNINGNFVSTLPVIGVSSGASYFYNSVNVSPVKYATINIVPNPSNANANTSWIANTTINEY
jgi:hypothetical protein